ncbi:MAG: DUF2911 domain-containing protein [Flavobacteriales bacterium]|nr:DUF2911 domain-containing protein [Flavobacteriales bacterium]
MKILKWVVIVLVGLAMLGYAGFRLMQADTKKHSPEQTVVFQQDAWQVEVFYNRPFKKNREIFGSLVPFGETWRTGANEATTFTTNVDVMIGSRQRLAAGKYTLWTVPGESSWRVVFNDRMYGWGVGFDEKASRKPEYDVAEIEVPVELLDAPIEQFTIRFEEGSPARMVLEWDRTRVAVELWPA